MPAPKKTNAVRAIVTAVLPMSEIAKLSIKEACQRFADRAIVSQRAFAEMGKLHHAISRSLAKNKGQTVYGELRKLGIKDSTISNASYASKVFDLVVAGHLKEDEFDTFTYQDCLSISRVTGEKSKRRLEGAEVAVIVRAKPESFDEEFNSIFETGVTVEEATAQAEKAEADAKAAQAAAQAAAIQAAADAAAKKATEDAAAAAAAQAAADAAAAATTAAANPTPAAAPSAGDAPTGNAPTATVEPSADAPAPAAAATASSTTPPATSEVPSNVVPMAPDSDAALPQVLSAIDDLLVTVSNMSVEARTKVFGKLHEACANLSDGLPADIAAVA